MASLSGVLLLVHISLMATTLFYYPSHAIGQDVVEQVCQQTEDYQFCFNIILRDPRTPAVNMEGLCLLSVAITIDHVREAVDKIPGLLEKATDPVDKQRMTTCQSNYGAAAGDFQRAWGSASSKAFHDVLGWVQKGSGQVINCENIYRQSPPIRESPLTVDNHNVIKLAGITLVVLGMLGVRWRWCVFLEVKLTFLELTYNKCGMQYCWSIKTDVNLLLIFGEFEGSQTLQWLEFVSRYVLGKRLTIWNQGWRGRPPTFCKVTPWKIFFF